MTDLKQSIADSEKILVGIGNEWACNDDRVKQAYDKLYIMLSGKDYFIVTTCTDGYIMETKLDALRITAPCGNETWRQCRDACTKDIWEQKEVPDNICPHCGAPLVGNTIKAEHYIEEGYMPQWNAYMKWLTGTVNKKLLVLEFGVDFSTPTVIRWPFEKTVFFNKKSVMLRVNKKFYQMPDNLLENAKGIEENSVEFILEQNI